MIKKVGFFFLILNPLILLSQSEIPFDVGESCTYRIHYGPITAGYGTLSVESIEKHNNHDCFHFKGIGYTSTLFNLIFKVFDTYVSYTDIHNLEPVHFIRDVNEGGYIIKQNYLFNNIANNVIVEDFVYDISQKTQDMLSGFYFTRVQLNNQNVKKDSIINLNIFMDEENFQMQIRYEKNELVKTKWGKIDCMIFIPQLQKGRVFKDRESMKIWISDDENKIMIKVETKIILGTIKAELNSFQGLNVPLSIIE